MADFELNELELLQREKVATGQTKTRNDQFEKDGYFVVEDLWDPEELYYPIPKERGQFLYYGSLEKFDFIPYTPNNPATPSPTILTRESHPQYKKIHFELGKKLEKIVGNKLYRTYYHDRYYFEDSSPIKKRLRCDSSEISVLINISNNFEEDWPLWIKTPDTYMDKKKSVVLVPGQERSITLKPGDGLIFKGCERPTWRSPMPLPKKKWFRKKTKEFYSHQIFFHYVLANGIRSQLGR